MILIFLKYYLTIKVYLEKKINLSIFKYSYNICFAILHHFQLTSLKNVGDYKYDIFRIRNVNTDIVLCLKILSTHSSTFKETKYDILNKLFEEYYE